MTPERWLVLTVRVPSEELTEELAEGLVALGGTAVEEHIDLLTTYVPEPAEPEAFLRSAADRLSAIAGAEPQMLWRWQDHEDWSRRWREGLQPRRVTERIVITQPWNSVTEGAAGEGADIVIVVEPAAAFGTGEHATTRGALRLLERALQPGERVLDVGTGSGILAIAAARLGAGAVLAVESDGTAIQNGLENLERNAVADRVRLVHAEVDAAYLERERGPGFDLIAANVLSGVLVPLLPALEAALAAEGRLILGGILDSEAAAVKESADAAGLRVRAEDLEGEWWSGLLERRRA